MARACPRRYGWAMGSSSFRARLRAFQAMRGASPDPGFIADLEFLENRDLDLSVRIGGMLAFNALMVTIGTHPISASPGAPLSVDAATQPAQTIASLIGIAPLVLSSALCLRALLVGEEFDADGFDTADDESAAKLQRRLFAAFVHSIDAQSRLLRRAVQTSFAGGTTTLAVWGWILAAKMW
ncbi:MAG: hypothetical protein H2054_02370 [Sphingomonas sp.]|nr:hypothetical protein [Zymomonas sp.]MBA4771939.1 hypothetical protein [Sphingomonas sp.]PZP18376.1 MAG: hypothetical protein DI607_05130 [Sphingomonas hengshuiensis]